MSEAKEVQERPKLVIVASMILFVCGLSSLFNFVVKFPLLDMWKAFSDLIIGLALLLLSYLAFQVSHLTAGMIATLLIGLLMSALAVSQQMVDVSLFYKGLGPLFAAVIIYFSRRKIPWLIEKEEPTFRELKLTLRMIKKSNLTVVAISVIIAFYVIAILAPYISPYNPNEIFYDHKLEPPSSQFLLGTDHLGRDILSRLIWGAQVSLVCGIVVVGISVIIGVPLGSISGYFGGKVDEVLMRFTDMVMAFPGLTLAMVMAYALGRGLFSAIIGLSMVSWTTYARLVRGVVISEKEKEYVTAARALGKSDTQTLFGEILPNSIHPIIVSSMMYLGHTIISVAGLSFVGVGIQPPTPDWGIMISDGRFYLMDHPLYAILPGVLIILLVLSFNIVGDTLRDALDPSLRRQR